jgi:hypothetical protein
LEQFSVEIKLRTPAEPAGGKRKEDTGEDVGQLTAPHLFDEGQEV